MKNRNMKQKITIAFGAVVICFFVTVGHFFMEWLISVQDIPSSIKITTKRSYV